MLLEIGEAFWLGALVCVGALGFTLTAFIILIPLGFFVGVMKALAGMTKEKK